MHNFIIIISSACCLILAACAGRAPEEDSLRLKPASYDDLPGWNAEDFAGFTDAFGRSCERILKQAPEKTFGPDGIGGTYGDWQPACRAMPAADNTKLYIEQWFNPYLATGSGAEKGLFTGYYEASLHGSKTRRGSYRHPLYKRPNDLVMVDLGEFRDELKGQRIAGRVIDARLRPYEDRASIMSGNWPHNDKVLAWVDNPVDSFFLHIQGSGRILLDNGEQMRVGYDGQNGHVYYAVGRELIKRGELTKENVSMQAIRQWMADHPGQADEIMNTNRSYVFFRELTEDGPEGGEGVTLTPLRSLAIDRSKMPYGTPVWLDIPEPSSGETPLRRLMVAQDTGGAIRGPVRGDVFWGYGPQAENMAGKMKAEGRYWLLLPKTIRR